MNGETSAGDVRVAVRVGLRRQWEARLAWEKLQPVKMEVVAFGGVLFWGW
jgi:hypothetical protein